MAAILRCIPTGVLLYPAWHDAHVGIGNLWVYRVGTPVWLLLAPRDYLSTFLKIGVIAGLAVGIVFAAPEMKMPAVTRFIDGSGPVFSGSLFPFLFITIACGAISGFHALVSSGTTPKLIERESHIRFIGYGAMLMESFVAIMALICASVIDPGVYFAMNSPAALIGTTVENASQVINSWGFVVTPETLAMIAKDVGKTPFFPEPVAHQPLLSAWPTLLPRSLTAVP